MTAATAVMMKELRDAVRSRWLAAFAVAFALVALALAGLQQDGDIGAQGFNRTTAGLINLALLLVPMLALAMGAGAVAGERDRGTLTTLLAQPLTTTELLLSKYAGLSLAIWMTVVLGFGAAGFLVALVSPIQDFGGYLLFIVLAGGLASATLSLGVLISVVSEGRTKAVAIAMLAWFVVVIFYQLVAIGLALTIAPSGEALVLAAVLNPVEAIRILAVLSLEPDLRVLGPLGAYLHTEFGVGGSALLLGGATFAWAAVPLASAVVIFRRQDI